jgi:glyoxylate reductase
MSPKPLVILTDPFIPEVIARRLKPHARVIVARDRAALLRLLPRADGLITRLSDRVDAALLARAPRLRAIANYAVGIDNVDLAACAARGVRVANTPDVLTRATAELTLALLLACARRVPEGEALCRSGEFKGWAPRMLLGLELEGRRALIVGQGRIGRETARIFRGVGLKVTFITRRDSAAGIRAKLKRAQVLSLHVPLTPATRHWLDASRLALLPKDAIVLNTTRGAAVDERALIRALKARRIFGAGLDVFAREPEIPAALRRLPNVVLLPHLGSATTAARTAMAELAVSGLLALLGGRRPANEVVSRP